MVAPKKTTKEPVNTRIPTKIKTENGIIVADRPLVEPAPDEPKSGCLWCPLLPYSRDFEKLRPLFGRDADKILAKEDKHVVKSRRVESKYKHVEVLFVGEAPGATEDTNGEAFIGEAGKLLRQYVEDIFPQVKLDPNKDVAYTNICRCRPPRNRNPGKTEVRSCIYQLVREIKARKPKLIVILGGPALEAVTGHTGILTFHDKFLKSTLPGLEDADVLACIHPSYVNRMKMDETTEKFGQAICHAADYISGEYEPPMGKGEYYVLDDADDVCDLLDAFREDGDPVAFDTECGSLTPFQDEFPKLLCFSFSNEEGIGYTVPFDHAESPWREGGPKKKDRVRITKALRNFFLDEDLPKVAQNEKFDRQHIRHALGVEPTNVFDTMTTHLVIDERRGTHGLKVLAFAYTGMGGYEKELEDFIANNRAANPDNGGSYANIPASLLFPYAGMDADVTLRVYNGIREEPEYVNSEKLQALAEHFLPVLSEQLADLEYTGAMVDADIVAALDEEYTAKMEDFSSQIAKLPKVRQFVADTIATEKAKRAKMKTEKARNKVVTFDFNPGSPTQLRKVLFDYYGLRPIEMTDTGFSRLAARLKQRNETRRKRGEPEVSFSEIVNASVEKKEWEFFTTKADVLHDYERKGNDLAPLILKYREAETLHGTFIAPLRDLLDVDGRVHGTYLIHGTVTGRLASRDPNLQNIPNKDAGKVKRAYVSRFGDEGVILQLDYSQIELRIAASYFNEPTMIEAYQNGEDLHTLTAIDVAQTSEGLSKTEYLALPDDDQYKKRTRAKRVNFGVLYQGGPAALMTTLKKDGIFITFEEGADLIEAFYAVRPALRLAIDRLQQQVQRDGFVESFTGRKRRVPEAFSDDREIRSRALRQSVNAPIQCGASDMTLMALVLINAEMREREYRSKMILTVHDNIVFDCHVDEVMEIASLAKEVMENLPELSDQVLPGIEWDWLKVPIVADCEIGVSWGQLVGFDPTVVTEENESDEELFDEEGKPVRDPVNTDELWELMAYKAAA